MSGKFLARASALLLTLFLVACGGGGGDDSAPLVSTGDSDSSSGDNSNDDTITDGSDEQAVTLQLGSGSGSSFTEGVITASKTDVEAREQIRLEFSVVNASDGNALYNAESVTATISSSCSSSNFDQSVTTTSGYFVTTYEPGCGGSDTITASLSNGATASVVINVEAPVAYQLKIISTNPESIALKGSANTSRPSVSEVIFQLLDKDDQPITTGETITFELSTTVGGIELSQKQVETDEEGYAKVRVNAGTIATVVSVTATYESDDGKIIETTSSPISISNTIPDQDSFSLSIEGSFVPNAWRYDGIKVPLTIRAADRNNNRISGAVVNFITTYGSIESDCILEDGECEVTWISQGERPVDGVVLILARTVGEESFRDLNSDGKYTDTIDTFDTENDKGEAFLDRNRNGMRDDDEEYFDYNSNNQYDGPNGIYNGSACVEDGSNCTTDLLEISQTGKIFMANDRNISIEFSDAEPLSPGEICVTVSAGQYYDSKGNLFAGPPPAGTTIAFSTTNGSILAPSTITTSNEYRERPVDACVTVEADDTPSSGTLSVEVTPPEPFSDSPYVQRATLLD